MATKLTQKICQLLINITQQTSINAISIKGITFSNQEKEYFKFWFCSPFGETNFAPYPSDEILLIRYLDFANAALP